MSADRVGAPEGDPLILTALLDQNPPVALIKDDDPLVVRGRVVDRFGTEEVAERLAGIVGRVDPPYTISLSGAWGVGKTWVAKRLRSHLEESKVPVVEVDLWSEDIDELRRTLAVKVGVRLAGQGEEGELQKAEELDRELRRPETEAMPVQALVPGLISRRGLALLSVAIVVFLALWVALSQPAPAAGTSPAPWVAPVASAAIAALIWLILQSGLVLSISPPTSTLPPIRETVALRRKLVSFVTKDVERKVLVVIDNLGPPDGRRCGESPR